MGSHSEWELIHDGIDLIETSRLATWDGEEFRRGEEDCFDQYWPRLDLKYGRWFCWLAFGTGIESILRGAYQVRHLPITSFGSNSHKWQALGIPANRIDDMNTYFKRLVDIRNEGAHEFIPGVRKAYFSEIETKFVPAINLIMEGIDASAGLKEWAVASFND
jgi:hypothetical protein